MREVGRSWTDAVTNAALLAGFDTIEYLKWLQHRPAAVSDVLAQFLHEATHHWCFHSVVGNTIALLRMRARRARMRGDVEGRRILREDLVRYQSAAIMLQPLSEGLALFAEFDTYPGEGDVMSQTLASALICFGFAAGEDEARHMEIALLGLLQTLRRRRQHLERKAGIFAMRHECEDGYLAGYMAVKALHATLVPRCSAFEDRDLFLAYLRGYIYDDLSFVLTILSDERNEIRLGEAIANYVIERIGDLYENDQLAEDVARWSSAVKQGRLDFEALGGAPGDEALVHEGMIGLVADAAGEGPQSEFAVHAFSTFQGRKFLVLGEIAARVAVDEEGTGQVSAIDDPGLVYELHDGPSRGSDDARILVATSTKSRYLAVLLVVPAAADAEPGLDGAYPEPECFVLKSYGAPIGEDWQELRLHSLNLEASTAIHDRLEAALEDTIESSELSVILDHNRRNTLRAAEHLYGQLATLIASEEAMPGILQRLREGGLLAIMDNDSELLRGLAAIGLVNAVSTDVVTVKGLAGSIGVRPEALDRTLLEAKSRHGLPLLSRIDDSVLAYF